MSNPIPLCLAVLISLTGCVDADIQYATDAGESLAPDAAEAGPEGVPRGDEPDGGARSGGGDVDIPQKEDCDVPAARAACFPSCHPLAKAPYTCADIEGDVCADQLPAPLERCQPACGGLGLPGADLRCALLPGVNLSGADLTGANLSRAFLDEANLQSALLVDANLNAALLIDARLTGADLTGADLSGANMTGANLAGVIWGNTTCPDGTNSDLNGGSIIHPARSCEGHQQ